MIVRIYTNSYPGGWSRSMLEDGGIGGSEESVILLSEALTRKGHTVVVYHSQAVERDAATVNGVDYRPREQFEYHSRDVVITFKTHNLWDKGIVPYRKIHWSCDVEKPWDISSLDAFVHISHYHLSRHLWLNMGKARVIPLGVDMASLHRNRVERVPRSLLYCSSPDRGLERLLIDWPMIQKNHAGVTLRVAYGWSQFDACTSGNRTARDYKNMLLKMMQQPGIENLGCLTKQQIEAEYWRAQYWCLPLSNPDSELFCLNAIKARVAGAIPVVNQYGALRNTVAEHIPYPDFVQGKNRLLTTDRESVGPESWDEVAERYWLPLFE